jgi:hypothetical protein
VYLLLQTHYVNPYSNFYYPIDGMIHVAIEEFFLEYKDLFKYGPMYIWDYSELVIKFDAQYITNESDISLW